MSHIVFLDRNSLSRTTLIPEIASPHSWQDYASTRPDEVIEHCKNATVVVLSKVPITDQVLAACPAIRHIAVAATGFNIVDLNACRRRGISVSNVPSYASTSVSEHVINMALSLRRELIQYRQQVIDGAWQTSAGFCLFDKPVNDLAGSTMGIIGFGEIGQATARLAHALGMKIVFSARRPMRSGFAKQLDFAELITTADIISLHCSLNDSTRNLISSGELNDMQKHAILINTARGGIVDEPALVNALQTRQIAGIGIDTLLEEPPKDDSPLLQIAGLTNVIITPHSAWLSQQAMQKLADILADNINGFLSGKPQNLVGLNKTN
ncbi:MAG: D-2-hydroxyacid dehydrogenase [Gammaproteobacteria bacterium]|nr:D-2-hydroxyacid dehydrogenase [Gammaproteobacteria bacterium]